MVSQKYLKNKTTEFFHKLDKIIFVCSSMNYWVDDNGGFPNRYNGIPELVVNAYRRIIKVINAAIVLFVVAELGSFFTQNNLTEKQKSDRVMMTFSHIIMYSFTLSLSQNKETVTEILFALAVDLKKDFNDEETERLMLKRTKIYAWAFVLLCFNALIFYGVEGLTQVLFSDGTFVTMITVWPEVHDRSPVAGVGRVVVYILWWLWMIRITTSYLIVFAVTISLSHQYMNLQMYFKSLAGVFEERISQSEKEEEEEKKFERALKLGIRLHATTIWCTQQVQRTCGNVFSGHIVVNIGVLVQVMSQFKDSDRAPSHLLAIAGIFVSMLFSTGFIMWSAGDITVEAGNLPTAIFMSGWQNCTNMSSYRIRRLMLIAMTQSQKPVIMKSCGFIELSYQSYLSIVKTSYSIFSVLY
ncbi:LOW QUALITY PROTEIN: odorant receptor 65a-like [Cydia fagiglandana]|uniref:LOW QUALITY PROTEIN: odorant receptor 65a-like n=1 Tax=Cydia fagiglandana TaxID=1458189 RepID=UPI002FEE619E